MARRQDIFHLIHQYTDYYIHDMTGNQDTHICDKKRDEFLKELRILYMSIYALISSDTKPISSYLI